MLQLIKLTPLIPVLSKASHFEWVAGPPLLSGWDTSGNPHRIALRNEFSFAENKKLTGKSAHPLPVCGEGWGGVERKSFPQN